MKCESEMASSTVLQELCDQLDHVAEDEAGQQVDTGLSLPGRPGISCSGVRKLVKVARRVASRVTRRVARRVTRRVASSAHRSCSSALLLSRWCWSNRR